MKREQRIECARESLSFFEQGFYINGRQQRVELSPLLDRAANGTKLYRLSDVSVSLAPAFIASNDAPPPARITVTPETTQQALSRLVAQHGTGHGAAQQAGHLACLNFASARNPGGGFFGGAQAQEECLARSSGLYPCLLKQPAYYEENRAHRPALYLDLAIFSPAVPFIRDDEGGLFDAPLCASVITCPAPNAGAVASNTPELLPQLASTLERRAAMVLAIAKAENVRRLVLGAWGCGVFRNEPHAVATSFAQHLQRGSGFRHAFDEIVFAIYDSSAERTTLAAFQEVFENLK